MTLDNLPPKTLAAIEARPQQVKDDDSHVLRYEDNQEFAIRIATEECMGTGSYQIYTCGIWRRS